MPEEQGGNRNELGQFEKGKSGNPGGRPKGSVGLNRRIRELLLSDSGSGKPVAEVLVEVLIREAIKNPAKMWPFIKEVMERDEGPVERGSGATVNIGFAGGVPQAPPLEGGIDGSPPLAEHASRIVSIIKERGLGEVPEVFPADILNVTKPEEES